MWTIQEDFNNYIFVDGMVEICGGGCATEEFNLIYYYFFHF